MIASYLLCIILYMRYPSSSATLSHIWYLWSLCHSKRHDRIWFLYLPLLCIPIWLAFPTTVTQITSWLYTWLSFLPSANSTHSSNQITHQYPFLSRFNITAIIFASIHILDYSLSSCSPKSKQISVSQSIFINISQ